MSKNDMVMGMPVALPERKAITAHGLTALDSEAEGWNACLDEIAKLGPLYARPIPTQGAAKPVGEVVGRRMEKFRFMPQVKWADDAQNGRTQPGTKLYTHAEAGEVERLRAHMAKVENMLKIREEQNEEFGKLIEEQHAKLAEAHALLRGLAKDQDGSVLEEWRAALADSAEPSAPVEIDERAEFERENRYIVLKRNRLSFLPMELQARLKCALDDAQAILTNLDCVVVEKDWPEYEAVWESIAARVALAHKP